MSDIFPEAPSDDQERFGALTEAANAHYQQSTPSHTSDNGIYPSLATAGRSAGFEKKVA